jgi:hypothetical protein
MLFWHWHIKNDIDSTDVVENDYIYFTIQKLIYEQSECIKRGGSTYTRTKTDKKKTNHHLNVTVKKPLITHLDFDVTQKWCLSSFYCWPLYAFQLKKKGKCQKKTYTFLFMFVIVWKYLFRKITIFSRYVSL